MYVPLEFVLENETMFEKPALTIVSKFVGKLSAVGKAEVKPSRTRRENIFSNCILHRLITPSYIDLTSSSYRFLSSQYGFY